MTHSTVFTLLVSSEAWPCINSACARACSSRLVRSSRACSRNVTCARTMLSQARGSVTRCSPSRVVLPTSSIFSRIQRHFSSRSAISRRYCKRATTGQADTHDRAVICIFRQQAIDLPLHTCDIPLSVHQDALHIDQPVMSWCLRGFEVVVLTDGAHRPRRPSSSSSRAYSAPPRP